LVAGSEKEITGGAAFETIIRKNNARITQFLIVFAITGYLSYSYVFHTIIQKADIS
jgi:hypothetical protein